MKIVLIAAFSFALMGLSGCADQSEQKFKNKAKAEGEADADANTAAQEKVALKMEADLARLQRFYQGVRGLYKGSVKTPSGRKFKVELNIHPTVELYESSRIRTVDEINAELQRLAFDVGHQISSVLSDGSEMASTCDYVDVKPGIDKGVFYLHEAGCGRYFQVNIVPEDSATISSAQALEKVSRELADQLLKAEATTVDQLQVVMTTQNVSTPMTFTMKRVK